MENDIMAWCQETVGLLEEYIQANKEDILVLGDQFYAAKLEEDLWKKAIDLAEFFNWLCQIQPALCQVAAYEKITGLIYDLFSDGHLMEDYISAIEEKDGVLVGDLLNDEWGPFIIALEEAFN